MLHDIGQLVLAAGMPGLRAQILALVSDGERAMHEAELEVLGCDHAQIGAYLMGLWGLPDGIVEAIAYHHDLGAVDANEFTPTLERAA